jgi:glycolate oxidase iron-sulfur subunit
MRADAAYAEPAQRIAGLAKDISEFLNEADVQRLRVGQKLNVAYHPACSLQHGQKITTEPRRLLECAGFTVQTPKDAHLCCGSAGSYNILQPEIAAQLGDRKVATLTAINADVIAMGNVGCMLQLQSRTKTPVVHTIELLDWATGGPMPPAIEARHRVRPDARGLAS